MKSGINNIIMTALLLATGTALGMSQSTWQSTLPIKPQRGVTVAGTVECDGRPVEGVKVSDGYEVVKTDKRGAYYLKSKKTNPQLFITAPSGYEPMRSGPISEFWSDFVLPASEFERHDFRLKKVDNRKHAILFITDVHLANQRRDVETFSNEYVENLRKEAKRLQDQGMAVYTINLGDMSWDRYWYGHKFDISDFRKVLEQIDYPTAIYSVMGNHDNDGGVATSPDIDYLASLPYQKVMGPRYYSQNIGGVHYVMLDNIEYLNEPAKEENYPGLAGRRNYKEGFSVEQLAWLRKDLSDVPYDVPIVLNYHGPIFKTNNKEGEYDLRTDEKSTRELLEIVKPYKEVHAFSGHSHKQKLVRLPKEQQNFIDHNIAGTSGAWWKTPVAGYLNLCPDALPAAYELMTVDGTKISWEHRCFELPAEKQFFTWDMNRVKEYATQNGEMQAFLTMFPEWGEILTVSPNSIDISMFAYDPAGSLKIYENGKELSLRRVMSENPLYITAYMIPNTIWLNKNEKQDNKAIRFPVFRAEASSANSEIEVVWTDSFGRVFREVVDRKSSFNPATYRR